MEHRFLKVFFCLVVFFLAPFTPLKAQLDQQFTDPNIVKDRDINVTLTPDQPGPNQNVVITIGSYATDLNKATITWTVDGVQKLSGVGKTKISITTGSVGKKTEITIAIIVQEGTRVDKKIVITPAELDVLWEAPDTYTPPFYKGKALAAKESKVRFFGLPIQNDGSVNPGIYNYQWQKNFKIDQPSSGYGKYWFDTRNNYLDLKDTINVTASGLSTFGGTGSVTLSYLVPKIFFYEDSPTYGPQYQKLLNNGFSLGTKDLTLIAEPFFFSKKDNSITGKTLQYTWTVNNKPVPTPSTPNKLTVRGTTQTGVARVSASITNTLTLFQEAKELVEITLGGK